ncbi:MAG: hypothetical protein L3J76_00700 [Candidatus Hydrothermae bacterium]|nr:hypothetical protein [Candidatus Hydrothermae bacterium]
MNLEDLLRDLSARPEELFLARVVAGDEEHLTCEVLPEFGTETLKDVSLRVVNLPDAFGLSVVPPVGTLTVVGRIRGRHLLLRAQRLDKLILEEEGLRVTLSRTGEIHVEADADANVIIKGNAVLDVDGDATLQATGRVTLTAPTVQLGPSGQYAALLGELVKQYLDPHTHPTPTGPSGPPTVPLPDGALSGRVKLDP